MKESMFLFMSLFLITANAFCSIKTQGTKMKNHHRSFAVIDPFTGQVPPLGFFDPLGLSVGTDQKIYKRWQESEVKHGRVAMIAVVAALVAENYHPFFPDVTGPSISHFAQVGRLHPGFWSIPFLSTGIIELYSIATAWAPRKDTKGTVAFLNEDYIPGDLGFDPLHLGNRLLFTSISDSPILIQSFFPFTVFSVNYDPFHL